MIILAGWVDFPESAAPDAEDAIRTMTAASRAEAGCLEYGFARDLEKPGRFRVFEIWRDEQALAAHRSSEHMARWRERIAALGTTGRDVRQYEGATPAGS